MMTRKSDTDPMGNILRQRTTLSLAVPPASRQPAPPAGAKAGGASPVVPPTATTAPGLAPAPVRKGDTDPMADPLRARTTLPLLLPVVTSNVESAKANEEAAGEEGPTPSASPSLEPASASEPAPEPSAESSPAGDASDFEIEDGKRPLDQSEIRELFSSMARAMDPTVRKVAPESEAAQYVEPRALPPRNPTAPEEPAIVLRASVVAPLLRPAPAPSAPSLVRDAPPVVELPVSSLPPPGSTTVQTRPLRSRKSRARAIAAGAVGTGVVLFAIVSLWRVQTASPQPSTVASIATVEPPPDPPSPSNASPPSPPLAPVRAVTSSAPAPAPSPAASATIKEETAAPMTHPENTSRVGPTLSGTKKPATPPQAAPRPSAKPSPEAFPFGTERK